MSSVEGYCILIYSGCTLIFSKVCFTCSVNRLTIPFLDSWHILKRVILAFISLFWLQRSLVFVSNIYAIYLFISLSHWTGAGVVSVAMSSSLAALEVVISTTYGAASDESALRVATFPFQRASIYNSDNGAICAGRITVGSAQSHCDFSLCVVAFSLLSFSMLLLFYVTFVYFMLSMLDNSPCGYCYLLTIPDVK